MNVPQKDIKQSKKTQRNTNIPCVLDKTRNTQVNMHSRRRLSLGGRPDSVNGSVKLLMTFGRRLRRATLSDQNSIRSQRGNLNSSHGVVNNLYIKK